MIVKGPYLLGLSLAVPVLMARFLPSNHTCCPSVYCCASGDPAVLLRASSACFLHLIACCCLSVMV